MVLFVVGKLPWFADPSGQQDQFGGGADLGDDPLSIGRKEAKATVPEAYRGRAIHFTEKHAVVAGGGFTRLGENNRLAVGRDIAQKRPVEPGKAALAGLAGREYRDAHASFVGGHQDLAGAADVLHGESAGRAVDEAFLSREIKRIDRPCRTRGYGGEPYFFPIGRPGQSFDA